MKKILIIILGVVFLLVIGFFVLNEYIYQEKQGDQKSATNAQNATYVINGEVVTLIDGVSEVEAAPNSASKITTRYFGNEVSVDIDTDGSVDTVFLLTQETGGVVLFYYAAAALNKPEGYVGSQGYLLGDRIAPQTTEVVSENIILINYAVRNEDEPFTAAPSIGKSIWLFFDTTSMQFADVSADFKTDVSATSMTLQSKSWTWEKTEYRDGTKVTPIQTLAFTLGMLDDGTFSATTDCNSLAGTYTTAKDTLQFSGIVSTKMFCEGSQESIFAEMLENTERYTLTSEGLLLLSLKDSKGIVTFR